MAHDGDPRKPIKGQPGRDTVLLPSPSPDQSWTEWAASLNSVLNPILGRFQSLLDSGPLYDSQGRLIFDNNGAYSYNAQGKQVLGPSFFEVDGSDLSDNSVAGSKIQSVAAAKVQYGDGTSAEDLKPAEPGAQVVTGKSLTELVDRNADNIDESPTRFWASAPGAGPVAGDRQPVAWLLDAGALATKDTVGTNDISLHAVSNVYSVSVPGPVVADALTGAAIATLSITATGAPILILARYEANTGTAALTYLRLNGVTPLDNTTAQTATLLSVASPAAGALTIELFGGATSGTVNYVNATLIAVELKR